MSATISEFSLYESLRLNLSLSYFTVFINLEVSLVIIIVRSHQEGKKLKSDYKEFMTKRKIRIKI